MAMLSWNGDQTPRIVRGCDGCRSRLRIALPPWQDRFICLVLVMVSVAVAAMLVIAIGAIGRGRAETERNRRPPMRVGVVMPVRRRVGVSMSLNNNLVVTIPMVQRAGC